MMDFDHIVDRFIKERRRSSHAELDQFRNLPSLRHAIRHAALSHRLPDKTRHPHQRRIPKKALQDAERALQRVSNTLLHCRDFEALHDQVALVISPIAMIGSLTVYDIAHRIGAWLGKSPRLVYLHRGTAVGARHLGFHGTTVNPKLLPAAFSRLTPEEIEDCFCIYKDKLAGWPTANLIGRQCIPRLAARRSLCGNAVSISRRC